MEELVQFLANSLRRLKGSALSLTMLRENVMYVNLKQQGE